MMCGKKTEKGNHIKINSFSSLAFAFLCNNGVFFHGRCDMSITSNLSKHIREASPPRALDLATSYHSED